MKRRWKASYCQSGWVNSFHPPPTGLHSHRFTQMERGGNSATLTEVSSVIMKLRLKYSRQESCNIYMSRNMLSPKICSVSVVSIHGRRRWGNFSFCISDTERDNQLQPRLKRISKSTVSMEDDGEEIYKVQSSNMLCGNAIIRIQQF